MSQETKFDVISIDWTQSLKSVISSPHFNKSVQGNLDPAILFAEDEVIIAQTQKMIKSTKGTKYIANLGWGMLPEHDPAKLKVFVDAVHSY